MSKADELYREEYLCPGPGRLVSNVGGGHPLPGARMSIARCMEYPDCGCHVYDRQIRRWEAIQKEAPSVRRVIGYTYQCDRCFLTSGRMSRDPDPAPTCCDGTYMRAVAILAPEEQP